MANPTNSRLSKRIRDATEEILPGIRNAIAARIDGSRKERLIDLGTAENFLMKAEMTAIYRDAPSQALISDSRTLLPYPEGFGGAPELVDALASLFNRHFQPSQEVLASQIVVAPGATACLEAFLHCICDSSNQVLVLAPYWSGFKVTFAIRPNVRIVPVGRDGSVDDILASPAFIKSALRSTMENAVSDGPVRALILTNPHNPFARVYTKEVVEACAQFCEEADIHLIFDEVYALSLFAPAELDNSGEKAELYPEFASALTLDLRSLAVDPSRVHVVWSLSKDFGSSGLRLGAVISQANQYLRTSLALASNIQVSSLTASAVTGLLKHPELDRIIDLNRLRLREAYGTLTEFLKTHVFHYIPANAGPFILARIPRKVTSLEEERALVKAMASAGVIVSPGSNYAWSPREFGWIRITFAVEPSVLADGLRRIVLGLQERRPSSNDEDDYESKTPVAKRVRLSSNI